MAHGGGTLLDNAPGLVNVREMIGLACDSCYGIARRIVMDGDRGDVGAGAHCTVIVQLLVNVRAYVQSIHLNHVDRLTRSPLLDCDSWKHSVRWDA
jgi:hypothetical protein